MNNNNTNGVYYYCPMFSPMPLAGFTTSANSAVCLSDLAWVPSGILLSDINYDFGEGFPIRCAKTGILTPASSLKYMVDGRPINKSVQVVSAFENDGSGDYPFIQS